MARTKQDDRNNSIQIWTPAAGQLTSIVATIPGWNAHKTTSGVYRFPKVATVHEAIRTCDNFESLSLRFNVRGCTGFPDRYSLPFKLEGGDKYPPLTHLSLEGYRFDDSDFQKVHPPDGVPLLNSYAFEWFDWVSSGRAKTWWNWRRMPPETHLRKNAELWANAMDWSQLKSLHLSFLRADEFVKHISSKLANLQELRLSDLRLQIDNAPCGLSSCSIGSWLTALQPLKRLAWLNGGGTDETVLKSILERHGPSLEALEIYTSDVAWLGSHLSTSQISLIGEMAPNLKKLAIGITRNGTWPFETLKAISSIPRLEKVELWMEYLTSEAFMIKGRQANSLDYYFENEDFSYDSVVFRKYGTTLFRQPLLNASGVTQLWEFMKVESGGRIQSVAFRAGDFCKPPNGPLHSPSWWRGRWVSWMCDDDGCRATDRERDVFEQQEDLDTERSVEFREDDVYLDDNDGSDSNGHGNSNDDKEEEKEKDYMFVDEI